MITPGQGTWQLETRLKAIMNGGAAEHIREGIPVLASYCDALGVRAFAEGKNLAQDLGETLFRQIDELCDKPLINMESAMNHPCQALADWRTLDELKVPQRAKFVLSWVYHPKALPLAVPAATVHMAAMRGMEVVVARPEGFALPKEIMDKARQAASASGGSLTETSDRAAAMSGASVLYAKEWGHDHVLRRHRGGLAAARRPLGLVRAANAGSRAHCPTPSSCTACRCGAMSRWRTKCWTDRAPWSNVRPSTASWCRWPFCIACSPSRLLFRSIL